MQGESDYMSSLQCQHTDQYIQSSPVHIVVCHPQKPRCNTQLLESRSQKKKYPSAHSLVDLVPEVETKLFAYINREISNVSQYYQTFIYMLCIRILIFWSECPFFRAFLSSDYCDVLNNKIKAGFPTGR